MSSTKTLWGGRFRSAPDPTLTRYSRSDASHIRLVGFDVAGSRAHARELVRAGILDDDECRSIVATLDAIAAQAASGEITPVVTDEDIHTFIERHLMERLGDLGGKLRAGRSRNDQAANDLKLYLREEAKAVSVELLALIDALINQATAHLDSPAPGFTHLQAAQPIVFGHQLMAHAQALSRNLDRLRDWHRRSNRSPLGAAALAGSAIARDPHETALELGYEGSFENSIDAVGSRDHVAEFIFVTAMIGIDLSRLSEEIILWCSQSFSWAKLDDAFSTGSSIMPQKKNPDIAELTRGRSARLIGCLSSIMATLKGLPFAYNRDLIEDKKAAFEAVDTLHMALPAMSGLVRTLQFDTARMREAATQGFTLATEMADWLALRGVPFSHAHEITGRAVRYCEDQGITLEDLTPQMLAEIDPALEPAIMEHITVEAALKARSAQGGTAPEAVQRQIDRLGLTLAPFRTWAEERAQ
ncbi:argininosuccinate lyase [Agrobacterium albertimagni AOL15]|uniref:Argininosuccinate lyase n=1 Tax=Agrobacterium albertimagni AOL15 TaxID=1156935 RepID=K2QK32_9HYPH|nr:argininosuccinate lyase [Agrobacterium albertimagni]EKF61556.1 argininosuccinate lyase [Agrobacterium albertimagni AOL15]